MPQFPDTTVRVTDPVAEFRIFLSCVSSEFAGARDALAKALIARGLTVKWQEVFRSESGEGSLLDLVHNYVHDCDAVICVLGKPCGASPPSGTAEPYRTMRPEGIEQASYTQWEILFSNCSTRLQHGAPS